MSAVRDELERLLDELPEEDLVELATEIRGRTEQRRASPVTVSLSREEPAAAAPVTGRLRWPHLGPAALGAGVLLGWAAGLAGGPLAAILGVAAGLVLGDRLDQHDDAAATTDA